MAGSTRVTIEQIGKRLNISTSTVSRALRQDALIHPETRARVSAMAIDLGYQGRARQDLSRGKKNAASVFFSVPSFAQVRDSYITTCYLHGLTREAESAGMVLNLQTVESADAPEFKKTAGIPQSLWMGESGTVIVTGQHHEETIKALARKMQVISLVWEYPEVRHDLVSTPDIPGMEMMVRELVRLGHRRLAWIGGPFHGSFVEIRKAGFIHGCLGHDLVISDQTFFGIDLFAGDAIVDPERLLAARREGVTAFVCGSDHAAELVLNVLQAARVQVPREVSVTGFDHSLGKRANGSNLLTTIDPQFVEMGRAAVRLVKWRQDQPSASPMTLALKAQFVEGDSSGPAPKSRKK